MCTLKVVCAEVTTTNGCQNLRPRLYCQADEDIRQRLKQGSDDEASNGTGLKLPEDMAMDTLREYCELKRHLHLMSIERDARYRLYGDEEETPQHVLCQCLAIVEL